MSELCKCGQTVCGCNISSEPFTADQVGEMARNLEALFDEYSDIDGTNWEKVAEMVLAVVEQARQDERAKAEVLVEALEYYADEDQAYFNEISPELKAEVALSAYGSKEVNL